MNLLQFHDADLGVNLSCFEAGVAAEDLDEPDIGPVVVHVGHAAVPQQVATGRLLNSDRFHGPLGPVDDIVRIEAGAVTTQDQGAFDGDDLKPRLRFVAVTLGPMPRPLAQGLQAAFAALALAHRDEATRCIDVVEVEVGQLAEADAARIFSRKGN